MLKLGKVEQMLLALLRASLHQKETETAFFQGVSADEWKQCYQLAVKHGVMALAWEGVVRLPMSLYPPKALKINWGMAVESYENKYRHYCKTIDELAKLYAENGIATLQLKGVGYSSLYPVPSHREGGDIDIYTYAAEGSGLTDQEASALADQLMRDQGIKVDTDHSVKHSSFRYQGVTIENHKMFLNVDRYYVAPQVEMLLKRSMNPSLTLLEAGEVMTPSIAFNTLFMPFHALAHFPGMLMLHHLYDWAVLIHRYGVKLPNELKDTFFLDGIAALTRLCNSLLGTSVPVQGGEKIAAMIEKEMFTPKYPNDVPVSNKLGIIVFKTRRLLHHYRLKNSVLRYPLWKCIWESVVARLKEPETIFRRKFH